MKKYFARSVYDPEDEEARGQMHLASTFAGKPLTNGKLMRFLSDIVTYNG